MNISATKKLINISEEVQKPVHVPIVLGNECFIITQQDVRKIEDSRFLSYHKLGPNGEFIPIEAVFGQEGAVRDALVLASGFQGTNQTVNQKILENGAKCCSENQPMKPIKASIAQQMEWAHSSCNNSSPPFPFTQSTSTSMSDMPKSRNLCCCCNKPCCCAGSSKNVTHTGCNTIDENDGTKNIEGSLSARQMLKIRKSIEDTIGI